MNTTENICPNCKESNELEAIVCAHCGAALEDLFGDPGFETRNVPALAPENIRDWSIDESAAPEHGLAVYLVGESKPAFIDPRTEFVMGRVVDAASEPPADLLDLSPLGGYSQGVSRRHTVIRRTEHGYEILDLGSVNGTWLNNERLNSQKYYPLPSGSHVRLGSMRLYVLYRPVGGSQ
jgi:pSer/pThr/pTyr-binding forkhead associated (FHA) protein